MSDQDTSGPAFPSVKWETDSQGMTLRDYFAAKAMQGLVGYMGCNPDKIDAFARMNKIEISEAAYKYADAMLEARK